MRKISFPDEFIGIVYVVDPDPVRKINAFSYVYDYSFLIPVFLVFLFHVVFLHIFKERMQIRVDAFLLAGFDNAETGVRIDIKMLRIL